MKIRSRFVPAAPGQMSLTGWELAQAGGDRAVGAAERRHPGWKQHALECIAHVGQELGPGSLITSEQIRMYAHGDGQLPEPHSLRAWGPVMRLAERMGLIEDTGASANANDPRVHANMVTLWRFTQAVRPA